MMDTRTHPQHHSSNLGDGHGGYSRDSSSTPSNGGGTSHRKQRRKRNLSVRFTEQQQNVSSSPAAELPPPVVVTIEFPNTEFLSQDAKVRKAIWYTGLEIRAINQTNLDVIRYQQQQHESNDSNHFLGFGGSSHKQNASFPNHQSNTKNPQQNPNTNTDTTLDNDKNDRLHCRGLEHLLEGETQRKARIQAFVASLLKLQTDKKRKGSRPESTADALENLSRQHSKKDRKRAQKVGKQDYDAVHGSRIGISSSLTHAPTPGSDEHKTPRRSLSSNSLHFRKTGSLRQSRSFEDNSSSHDDATAAPFSASKPNKSKSHGTNHHRHRSLVSLVNKSADLVTKSADLVTKSAHTLTRSLKSMGQLGIGGSSAPSVRSPASTMKNTTTSKSGGGTMTNTSSGATMSLAVDNSNSMQGKGETTGGESAGSSSSTTVTS